MLLMVDPTLSPFGGLEPTGLEALLADYDVELGQDIVVDPANPIPFFGPDTIFVGEFGDHDVTRSLRQANLQVILPLARSVRRLAEAEGGEAVELFTTSSEGWAETDLENLNAVAKGEGDLEGPVSLAVAVRVEAAGPTAALGAPGAEAEPADASADGSTDGAVVAEPESEASPETRLVVVGDSDFASNSQIRQTSNAVLAANALNWLVERDALVGIPPKTPEQTKLTLSASQLSTITWLILVILPGLAIATGVAVHLRRRR
jgi:ABC-type uncharacterized transport system involved in gliding motility auxiliary subunit